MRLAQGGESTAYMVSSHELPEHTMLQHIEHTNTKVAESDCVLPLLGQSLDNVPHTNVLGHIHSTHGCEKCLYRLGRTAAFPQSATQTIVTVVVTMSNVSSIGLLFIVVAEACPSPMRSQTGHEPICTNQPANQRPVPTRRQCAHKDYPIGKQQPGAHQAHVQNTHQ